MSTRYKAVKANLYSVHWQNSKEGGYYEYRTRIFANDAVDAINASKPQRTAQKVKLVSCDLLAEEVTILVTDGVLTEDFETRGFYSDEEWRVALGITNQESFHARGRVK